MTTPNPDEFYTKTQRKLQEENKTYNLANAVVQAITTNEVQPEQVGFINSRDFFFLSTVNAEGEPSVSYKGGAVGFINVENPSKLVFPSYDGNGMYYSLGNITETGKVGILFIDMETPNRLRIQGNASVSKEPELMARYPGADMVVEIDITKVFANCARYIHKHERIEAQNKYVPNDKGEQPLPAWKRIDMIQEALHPKDIGRAEKEGGTITEDEYIEKVMSGDS